MKSRVDLRRSLADVLIIVDVCALITSLPLSFYLAIVFKYFD